MSEVDISVIVVGLNTRQLLSNCLRSLSESEWGGYSHEIIYVDNASKDDSVAMTRRDFAAVRVVANDTNRHFCPAANQGSKLAKG